MVYEDIEGQPNQQLANNQPGISGAAPSQVGNQLGSAPTQNFNQQNQRPDVGQQQQVGSGRFVNIQKYLSANQPAATGLGQKIQTNIGKQAEQVRQGIESSKQQFETSAKPLEQTLEIPSTTNQQAQPTQQAPVATTSVVSQGEKAVANESIQRDRYGNEINNIPVIDPGYYRYKPEINNTIYNQSTQNPSVSSLINLIKTNPNEIVTNQPQLETFRQLQTGIQGPQSTLTGQETSNLQPLVQSTGTEEGRFKLLQQMFAKPTQEYTRGQQKLDQLLLQASPQVGQNLQKFAQTQLSDIQKQITPAIEQQAARSKAISEAAQKAQQDISSTLGSFGEEGTGELGSLYSQLNQARQVAADKQQNDYEAAKKLLQDQNLGNETAALLGLDPGTRIYGLNLQDYIGKLNPGDTNITQADIITPEQQARLDALSRLSNLQPGDINLGEKYGSLGPSFGGTEDLKNRIKQYESDVNNQAKSIVDTYNTSRPERNIGDILEIGSSGNDKYSQAYRNYLTNPTAENAFALSEITKGIRGVDISQMTGVPGVNEFNKLVNDYAKVRNRVVGTPTGDTTMNVK